MTQARRTPPASIRTSGAVTFSTGMQVKGSPLNSKDTLMVECDRYNARLMKRVCAARWSGVVMYQFTQGLIAGCGGCPLGEQRYKEVMGGEAE